MKRLLAVILTLMSSPAWAGCPCVYDTLSTKTFIEGKTIFLGRALSTLSAPQTPSPNMSAYTTFEVVETWSGFQLTNPVVFHRPADDPTRCGVTFPKDSLVMVVAETDSMGTLTTTSCLQGSSHPVIIDHTLRTGRDVLVTPYPVCETIRNLDPVRHDQLELAALCKSLRPEEIELLELARQHSASDWLEKRYSAEKE